MRLMLRLLCSRDIRTLINFDPHLLVRVRQMTGQQSELAGNFLKLILGVFRLRLEAFASLREIRFWL